MTDSINLMNSSNTLDENKFQTACLFLTNEYNRIKKEKLSVLYEEVTLTKKKYNSHIKEYKQNVNSTLEKEKEIEQLYSKISKIKKRRALIINNSFNEKFYKHLLEIAKNYKKEKILKNFFSFLLLKDSEKERPIKDLIKILKDKEEIKNLIFYSSIIYSDLREKDKDKFLNLKKKYENYFSEIEDSEKGQYPFDTLFDCLNIIFEIIEHEKKIKENNEELGILTEKKNAKFVEIKLFELKIKNLNKNIKIYQNNLKMIRSFYDKFFEQKSTNISEQVLEELIKNIEEYQKQEKDCQKINQPGDVITSLTFGTFYTQSEDSSLKSSKLSSKNNGFSLINNYFTKENNNDSEIQQKENYQMDTYDAIIKSISNYNNNSESNDVNKKKNDDKLKIEDKVDKNIYNINKNNGKKNNNNKNKNKNLINNKSKDTSKLKENEVNIIKNSFKTYDIKFIENLKKNKLLKLENKKTSIKTILKSEDIFINSKQSMKIKNKNKFKNEEKKYQNENKENLKYYNITEDKELFSEKKVPYNFSDLQNLGSRMNQLKHREPDESIEMSMPKENVNKIEFINNENLFNDNSVCDEMVSKNYDLPNKNGRNTTNDYINKLGVKNNLVISKELYTDKILKRKNNNGKLQIEKSIEASTCCVSCT